MKLDEPPRRNSLTTVDVVARVPSAPSTIPSASVYVEAELSASTDIREAVRERYAAAATRSAEQRAGGCCGSAKADERFGATLYDDRDATGATGAALSASLGCGVPTAVADLHAGETVLDLGSGAGADVLISARRVGATGRAIGLDMTDEMLEVARVNAADAGLGNVEFVKGYIEDIP